MGKFADTLDLLKRVLPPVSNVRSFPTSLGFAGALSVERGKTNFELWQEEVNLILMLTYSFISTTVPYNIRA